MVVSGLIGDSEWWIMMIIFIQIAFEWKMKQPSIACTSNTKLAKLESQWFYCLRSSFVLLMNVMDKVDFAMRGVKIGNTQNNRTRNAQNLILWFRPMSGKVLDDPNLIILMRLYYIMKWDLDFHLGSDQFNFVLFFFIKAKSKERNRFKINKKILFNLSSVKMVLLAMKTLYSVYLKKKKLFDEDWKWKMEYNFEFIYWKMDTKSSSLL